MKKPMQVLTLIALLCLTAGAATAQNSIAVNNAAALNGTNFGLELSFDGSTSTAFVRDDSPNAESIYRASFWIDPNSAGLAAFDRFAAALGKDTSNRNVFRLQLQRGNQVGNYRLRLACLNNADVWKFARANGGSGGKALSIGDSPAQVLIETVMLNSNQGLCRMTVGSTVHINQGYQAGSQNINQMRMGLTKSAGAGFSGSVFFDEFESFRTLAP